MYIIVGLGNPGRKYQGTRHNIGFDIIEKIGDRNNINLNRMKFNSVYGEGFIGREKVILMKPQTYMNNSGVAVKEIIDFYKEDINRLIVIVDDIDIEFSSIRIKSKGSAGSHNGLKSIIKHIGSKNFPRVRVGVGNKKHPNQDLADFVLSTFTKEEQQYIDEAIETASIAVETIVESSIIDAMNQFN